GYCSSMCSPDRKSGFPIDNGSVHPALERRFLTEWHWRSALGDPPHQLLLHAVRLLHDRVVVPERLGLVASRAAHNTVFQGRLAAEPVSLVVLALIIASPQGDAAILAAPVCAKSRLRLNPLREIGSRHYAGPPAAMLWR